MNRLTRRCVVIAVVVAIGLLWSLPIAAGQGTGTGSVVTALPVVACNTQFGTSDGQPAPWTPTKLPVTLSQPLATRLSFYSNGFVTVLAPKRWVCAGVEAADGGRSLSVFPTGQDDPLTFETRGTHAMGVAAFLEYTGHGPGAQLVCSLFPGTRAASLAHDIGGCAPTPGERTQRPTADVVTFMDPPHLRGTGEPSGSSNPAYGAVIFPQLVPEPSSVNVSKVTCALSSDARSLCPAIVGDFIARDLPSERAPAAG